MGVEGNGKKNGLGIVGEIMHTEGRGGFGPSSQVRMENSEQPEFLGA